MYDFPPGSWAVRMKTVKEQGMVCGPRNPQARSCRPVSYGGMLVAGRVGTEEPREKLLTSAFNISKPPLFLKNPNPQCNRHAPEDGRRRDEKGEKKKLESIKGLDSKIEGPCSVTQCGCSLALNQACIRFYQFCRTKTKMSPSEGASGSANPETD